MFSEQGTSRILTRVSKAPWLTRQRGLRGMASDMEDRKSFLQQALGWADYRITASRFVHDVFVANGIQFPIKIQSYGHDLSWMDSYSGKTPSKAIRFGFIGQIIPSKGVHFILEAANLLQNSFGDKFSVSIYGNLDKTPDYSVRLRSLAANAESIKFCGTYAHEDSASVFANLDVLVVPSLWYDFPLIIYEAFATQTPVIATNLGGMAEAVMHEATGLLFERGDVDDLARQMKRIIVEPGLLERLRSQAPPVKTIVEEVNELNAIYRKLTSHT
jgi:glycosyltransferase involved in cell wall biosynthesis